MPSRCGGWRERGPCRPHTSHRPAEASAAAEGVGTAFLLGARDGVHAAEKYRKREKRKIII